MPLYYSEPDHVLFQQESEQITHHHHRHHRHYRSSCYPNHSDVVRNFLLNCLTSLNHNQVRRLLWHLSQPRFVFYTYVVTKNASKRLSFAIILLKLYVRPSARRPEDEIQNR